MMWLTTMNQRIYRRLVRVLPDEAENFARVFDLLLGTRSLSPEGLYR